MKGAVACGRMDRLWRAGRSCLQSQEGSRQAKVRYDVPDGFQDWV